MYAYVGNDPVNKVDPSGLLKDKPCLASNGCFTIGGHWEQGPGAPTYTDGEGAQVVTAGRLHWVPHEVSLNWMPGHDLIDRLYDQISDNVFVCVGGSVVVSAEVCAGGGDFYLTAGVNVTPGPSAQLGYTPQGVSNYLTKLVSSGHRAARRSTWPGSWKELDSFAPSERLTDRA